jgi:two-component system chemotaxis response regulator CheB
MNGLRVLVIDNSISFLDEITSELLCRLPSGSLVERAEGPISAQEKLGPFQPAIIAMNFAVGIITVDGMKFLTKLTTESKQTVPVIVYGMMGVNRKMALSLGAHSYLKRPGVAESATVFYDRLAERIKTTVASCKSEPADVGPGAMVTREIWTATMPKRGWLPLSSSSENEPEAPARPLPPVSGDTALTETPIELIAMGASTGGTEALSAILTRLRPPLPGIVVVQHIPPMFSRLLSERLDNECILSVKEAATGDIIEPNHVYIAPGSKHMTISKYGSQMVLHCNPGPPVHSVCPSVDILFDSVAREIRDKAIGVLLTGMGKDGADGLLHMREQGSHTLGQDESTSTVYGMPKAAFELGAVEKQLPLSDIPAAITMLARKKP